MNLQFGFILFFFNFLFRITTLMLISMQCLFKRVQGIMLGIK